MNFMLFEMEREMTTHSGILAWEIHRQRSLAKSSTGLSLEQQMLPEMLMTGVTTTEGLSGLSGLSEEKSKTKDKHY